jgi:hypothetical protein
MGAIDEEGEVDGDNGNGDGMATDGGTAGGTTICDSEGDELSSVGGGKDGADELSAITGAPGILPLPCTTPICSLVFVVDNDNGDTVVDAVVAVAPPCTIPTPTTDAAMGTPDTPAVVIITGATVVTVGRGPDGGWRGGVPSVIVAVVGAILTGAGRGTCKRLGAGPGDVVAVNGRPAARANAIGNGNTPLDVILLLLIATPLPLLLLLLYPPVRALENLIGTAMGIAIPTGIIP